MLPSDSLWIFWKLLLGLVGGHQQKTSVSAVSRQNKYLHIVIDKFSVFFFYFIWNIFDFGAKGKLSGHSIILIIPLHPGVIIFCFKCLFRNRFVCTSHCKSFGIVGLKSVFSSLSLLEFYRGLFKAAYYPSVARGGNSVKLLRAPSLDVWFYIYNI